MIDFDWFWIGLALLAGLKTFRGSAYLTESRLGT